MTSKRDRSTKRHHDRLWGPREELAKRSPIEAPVVEFDKARALIKRTPREGQNRLWLALANAINEFVAREVEPAARRDPAA